MAMKISIQPVVQPVLLTVALAALAALVSCGFKTYNMTDPGKPADAFTTFYRAVSDGDDATANELLYNYSWNSFKPSGKKDGGQYEINGVTVSGTDAMLFDVMLRSRNCRVVSESDYSRDDLNASVTVSYTSFDLSRFQKDLSRASVKAVKEKQRSGQNFSSAAETRGIIDEIKVRLLKEPEKYYSTKKYKVELICEKGRWKVILGEDFYKALSGNTD